jgi:AraC-like DNA-binding protein
MNSDLYFLHCAYMPRCAARIDKHFEGYYALQFMQAGGIDLYYDDEFRQLCGKWFWPTNPGPRIRYHPAEGYEFWEHRYAAFKGPLVQRWIAEGLLLTQPQPIPQKRDFTVIFDELLEHAMRTDRWGNLRAINLLERVLIELAELRAQAPVQAQWLEQLIAELDASETFLPDYQRLAKKLNMSLSTLRRRFKQETGQPLHDFLLHRRLARARALLDETDLPIKKIAEQLGYSDVYFFTRQFHRFLGLPPATFRKIRQR